MTVSSAYTAVAANIAPKAKQITLLVFILVLFRLAQIKTMATDAVALQLELPLVLGAVEMAFRFCDESVFIELPTFVAADSNAFSGAAGPVLVPVNVQWNAAAFD